ncbi:MAG: hypothetical protein WBO93_09080 [Gammaproteobacteria bacterium]
MRNNFTQWRRFIAALVACAVALALEGASGWVLWTADSSTHQLAGFLLFHVTACLIFASAVAGLLPLRQRGSLRRAVFFVFSLCFFIPWFGVLGVMGVLLPALWWPKKHSSDASTRAWSYLSIPPLPDNSPAPCKQSAMHFGVASIAGILHGASELGQRQQGVLDTLRLRDNEAIPLLRRALRDSEDDVRLLAYALLDRKEQAITARIRLRQKQLDGAEGDQRVGHHSAIAHDCWELIHLGLVQGEVMSYLLTTARKHVEDALLIRPRNAGLRLLLGKVLQRMGELALASESLRRAEELGIDSAIVGPELAAIAFSQQRLAGSRRDVAGFQPLTAG